MRRWLARLLILGGFVLAVVVGPLGSSTAQAADCKPDGVPNAAGSGIPGLVDDPTPNPSGETYYGEYGWAGLKWYTCDLGSGPDAVADPIAVLDTYFGNAGMGAATVESSAMTQLHEWAVDPGELLNPVDKVVNRVTKILRRALWNVWAPPVIILAAIVIVWHANTQQVRRSLSTVVAILISCGVVGWIMLGPVKAAQTFDDAVSSVVGGVDRSIVNVTGKAELSEEEARGATFHDEILYGLWCRGAVSNEKMGDEYCPKLYEASAVAYDDLSDFDSDDYRDDYNDVASDLEDEDDSHYDALKGKEYNRTGQGFISVVMMTMIALIRIPAEILMVAGLLVMRLAVMLGPIFALAGILEATRGFAIAAFKMVLASVINVAVYGVIAALHTALVAGVVAANPGLIASLVIVAILTILFWKLSKPFRSPTKLATGEEAGEQMAGMGDTSRMSQLMMGMLGAKLAGALPSRGGDSGGDGGGDSGDKPEDTNKGDDRDESFTRPDDGPDNRPGSGGPDGDGTGGDGGVDSGPAVPTTGGADDGEGLDDDLFVDIPNYPPPMNVEPSPGEDGPGVYVVDTADSAPSDSGHEATDDDADDGADFGPVEPGQTWRPETDPAGEDVPEYGPINVDASREYGPINVDLPDEAEPDVTVLATGAHTTHEVTLTEPEYTSDGELTSTIYRPDREESNVTVMPTEGEGR